MSFRTSLYMLILLLRILMLETYGVEDTPCFYKLVSLRSVSQNGQVCQFYTTKARARIVCAWRCSKMQECLSHHFKDGSCILCIAPGTPDLSDLVPYTGILSNGTEMWQKDYVSTSCTGSREDYFGFNQQPGYWEFRTNEWPMLTTGIKTINITLDFRTRVNTGLMLFGDNRLSNDITGKDDFIGAFLSNGHVTFTMNTHGDYSAAKVTSVKQYNDGEYHTAVFYQNGDSVKLCIDGSTCQLGSTSRKSSGGFITLNKFMYVGGIPDTSVDRAEELMGLSNITSYQGCIKNLFTDGSVSPPPGEKVNIQEFHLYIHI